MQKQILCFHHDDLDGTMSKAVFHYFKNKHLIKYVSCLSPLDTDQFREIDYSQFDEIYVLDLCFDEYIFDEMLEACILTSTPIFVCDHHQTGIPIVEAMEKKSHLFSSITTDWNSCATRNIYDHFVERYGIANFTGDDFARGYIVHAVNEFDTWVFEHGSKTHQLCLYLVSMDVNHTTFFKSPRIPEAQHAGSVLINALDFTVNELIESDRFFFGNIDGNKMVCINGVPLNIRSYLLNKALLKFDVDIAVHFMYYPSCIVISLRSKQDSDIDVSKIATQFGGGGHKNAAGFSVPRSTDLTGLLGLEDNNGRPQEKSV